MPVDFNLRVWDGKPERESVFSEDTKDTLFWFVAGKDGLFVHRPMEIGRVIYRDFPKHLEAFPYSKGILDYTFPPLPKEIMAQALDFFRRIYNSDKSEAEVLLVFDTISQQVKLFVPPQKCSGGSVHSAFNPEHLARGSVLIGSIHSHCNFDAFHSGTDTNDASEFDGIHITIGHVNTDKPSFAQMVMINRSKYDFELATLADTSDLAAATAPAWWDRYVLTAERNDAKIAATWQQFQTPRPTIKKYDSWQGRGSNSPAYVPPKAGHYRSWNIKTNEFDEIPYSGRASHGFYDSEWGDYGSYNRDIPNHLRDWDPKPSKAAPPAGTHQKGRKKKKSQLNDNNYQAVLSQLIDDFAEIMDELQEHSLYASDLAQIEELIRPYELVRFYKETGPKDLEALTNNAYDEEIEGQTLMTDFLDIGPNPEDPPILLPAP